MRTATSINTKLTKIGICTLLVFTLFITRLFYLQIISGSYFISRGKQNFLRIENTRPLRGNILDCNGQLLATNRPMINIYWHGSGNSVLSGDQLKIIDLLNTILDEPITNKKNTLSTLAYRERHKKKMCIATDLSMDQLSKIEELFPQHPNIALETHFERHYPHSHSASHVLGYLRQELDKETFGTMGLEKVFQDSLHGQQGTIIRTINSVGRNIAHVELEQARAGNDVTTTIDIDLQKLAEMVFPDDQAGTLILMDPYEGNIKALVSNPSFDPSLFLRPISNKDWNELQERRPFLNRALGASYPAGSIFKLITVSAALENNIVSEDDCFDCKGFYHFGGRKYWCNRRWGHGELTTLQAVAHSCNILFYEIGRKIDIDLLSDYAQKFGLGRPTNSLFPEKTGLVPSRRWKSEVKGERWWPGETLSLAIGQSFLLATPMQITRMIASIFTGYLVRPRILLSEEVDYEPLDINPETREFLQRAMRSAATKGTGRNVDRVGNMTIYAKTSTAQTSSMNKRHLGKQYLEHGWFVSYFAYKDNQPMTMVILVENSGTSRVATSIAKNFLIAYKKYEDQKLSA